MTCALKACVFIAGSVGGGSVGGGSVGGGSVGGGRIPDAGTIIWTGYFDGQRAVAPTVNNTDSYYPRQVFLDSTGAVVVGGSGSYAGTSVQYVTKVTATGAFSWVKSEAYVRSSAIALGPTDEVVFATGFSVQRFRPSGASKCEITLNSNANTAGQIDVIGAVIDAQNVAHVVYKEDWPGGQRLYLSFDANCQSVSQVPTSIPIFRVLLVQGAPAFARMSSTSVEVYTRGSTSPTSYTWQATPNSYARSVFVFGSSLWLLGVSGTSGNVRAWVERFSLAGVRTGEWSRAVGSTFDSPGAGGLAFVDSDLVIADLIGPNAPAVHNVGLLARVASTLPAQPQWQYGTTFALPEYSRFVAVDVRNGRGCAVGSAGRQGIATYFVP